MPTLLTRKKKEFVRQALLVLALASVATAGACSTPRETETQEKATLYQCPMHPDVTSHEPGDCPICGMRLVKVDAERMTPDTLGHDEHDGHGVEAAGEGVRSLQGGAAPGSSEVPDRASVRVPAERQQMLGVRTVEARVTEAVRSIRAVGFVEPDRDRVQHVHVKVEGWLERVRVQTEGERVEKGQVLFELHSPRLVATQEELLSALRAGNRRAADAARDRLRYWNLDPADIRAIEKRGRALRAVSFRSPISGYVQALDAVEGMYVKEMTDLYTLVDLEKVWVIGKFYETDLPFLSEGLEADVRLPDGSVRTGRALYVYPTVDRKTRFASVRFAFDNADFAFRPGMYVDLRYRTDVGPGLVLPADAVIRSGTRALAFVARGGGRFEPRELDLGPAVDDGYVVYAGVDDGERVVSQAAFFIDSESALRAAVRKFDSGEHRH